MFVCYPLHQLRKKVSLAKRNIFIQTLEYLPHAQNFKTRILISNFAGRQNEKYSEVPTGDFRAQQSLKLKYGFWNFGHGVDILRSEEIYFLFARITFLLSRKSVQQTEVLKVCDSVHDHQNNNVPNLKLKNLCGNERMKLMRNHITLKFIPDHMNAILVKTWVAFKLWYATITHKYFNKTPLLPLYPPGRCTNPQYG